MISVTDAGGKEPLEILFAKELKRRGIDSPTSMSGSYPSMTEEIDFQEDRYPRKKTRASRSMDLKSERLEVSFVRTLMRSRERMNSYF